MPPRCVLSPWLKSGFSGAQGDVEPQEGLEADPDEHEGRDFSSYVTDVSATSAGPFHSFSDVDLRTASLLTLKSFTSGSSLVAFSVTGLDQP